MWDYFGAIKIVVIMTTGNANYANVREKSIWNFNYSMITTEDIKSK